MQAADANQTLMMVDFVKKANHLPSIPSVALRVLEVGEDPMAGLSDLVSVVANDAVLAARLLRAANSPLYALRRKVEDLRQAIDVLGFNTTITLALSFSLAPEGQNGAFDKPTYWRRSLLAAVASRILSEALEQENPELFFLSGLLQDMGRLVFDTAVFDDYQTVCTACDPLDHEELIHHEMERYGFDHAQLGGFLMSQWRFPEPICQAIVESHQLNSMTRETTGYLERIIALSGLIADFLLDVREDERSRRYPILMEKLSALLDLSEEKIQGLFARLQEVMPDYSALFEIKLLSEHDNGDILARARDLLMLRNLKMIQDAVDSKNRTESLRIRNEELEQMAHSDSLTGLWNRGRLDEFLALEFAGAQSEKWPLSVAFIDLDHFKRINDEFGHLVGDEALRILAEELQNALRQTDIIGRYGGEEFVVLLPGTDERFAYSVMDRLREAIGEHVYRIENYNIQFSLSIGIATMAPTGLPRHQFEDAQRLLRAADRAVYMAKRSGRNCTIIYGLENGSGTPEE